ncbi:MAG: adenosylmethionine decarboxylase [Bacteroidota bacterium]
MHTSNTASLAAPEIFKQAIAHSIANLGLTHLGEVVHQFPQSGFTAVICLSESHISIHTWPEHGLANIDIYLSNYLQVNTGKVEAIFDNLCQAFGATVTNVHRIER